ncbi:hypothetical protein D3C73_1428100 [compost metagenome]
MARGRGASSREVATEARSTRAWPPWSSSARSKRGMATALPASKWPVPSYSPTCTPSGWGETCNSWRPACSP